MNLQEIFDYVKDALNKDQSGNITNDKKFNTFLKAVNITMFNVKAGLPQDYAPGQPIPRQALEVTQSATEDLRFCMVRMGGQNPVLPVNQGYAEIPDDFVRLSSIRAKHTTEEGVKMVPVEVVFDSEFALRIGSVMKRPTRKHPIAHFLSDTIEIAPDSITKVDFTYYRLPKEPYYDLTYENDNPVYLPPGAFHDGTNLPAGTPSRSVELEWPESLHIQFANRVVNAFSVSIQDQFSYQDSEKIKQQGQ